MKEEPFLFVCDRCHAQFEPEPDAIIETQLSFRDPTEEEMAEIEQGGDDIIPCEPEDICKALGISMDQFLSMALGGTEKGTLCVCTACREEMDEEEECGE